MDKNDLPDPPSYEELATQLDDANHRIAILEDQLRVAELRQQETVALLHGLNHYPTHLDYLP